MADTERISGGATAGMPTCPSCPHLLTDKGHPGWGWCNAPENRVMNKGWVNGFAPSQSPSGSCNLHPERKAGVPPCPNASMSGGCPCGYADCTKRPRGVAGRLPPGYTLTGEGVVPSTEPGSWKCKACGFQGFWRGVHCMPAGPAHGVGAVDVREQTVRKLLLIAQEWAAEPVPQENRSDRLELALRRALAFSRGVDAILDTPAPGMAVAQPWDASQVKQPGWHHVEAAFIEGAREARANPEAGEEMFRRAADGHTKRVFEEVDPVSEAALRTESWKSPAGVPLDAEWLVPDDMQALKRFYETCEDSQPYDVPKHRMLRLAELGVVQRCGRTRYNMTAFGQYVLDLLPDGWPRLPLKTHADHRAYTNAQIDAAAGVGASDGKVSTHTRSNAND